VDSDASTTGWMTIIGVAGAIRANPLDPDEAPRAILYRPLSQVPAVATSIVVRVRETLPPAISAIRSSVHLADRRTSIASVITAEEGFDSRIWVARFNTRVLVAFALLAIVLACLGVYATMSYVVATRRREIAIRLALGATPAVVVATVVRSAAGMLGVGLVAGIAGSLGTSRVLQSMLYGSSAVDVPILAAVVGAVALAGYAATWIPAKRASASDPSLALRGN
jgi:putative ABC transport system permease protein